MRVGYLYAGSQTAEQDQAHSWGRSVFDAVEPVSVERLLADPSVLQSYDVLWWHRARPVSSLAGIREASAVINQYLEDGGNLLLTLRAVSLVAALGIDSVPPDDTGATDPEASTGILAKSIYADHPLFDGFERLRVPTLGSDCEHSYARYDRRLPERGTVLASTVRNDRDRPAEVSVVSWTVDAGTVLGIGAGLTFDGTATDAYASNQRQLVENAIRALADDAGERLPNRPKPTAELRRLRSKLDADPHRPTYHLSPPANWLNDPNGLIEWNGTYHVFYQYNPGGPYHDTIHWGHAVSEDLIHWEDRPVALSPTAGSPDQDGCWSGCAIDDDGTPTIIYTGARCEWQLPCLATASDDDLSRWEPAESNPIIAQPPAGFDVRSTDEWEAAFRDHAVWRAEDTWEHLIGSGIQDVGGTVFRYTGQELDEWTPGDPLLVGESEQDGAMWECPELLDFGEKQLLHVSNFEAVLYFLGHYEDGSFTPTSRGVLDHGSVYAPQSLETDSGRYVTWGWVQEDRSSSAQWDAGWAGILSLPRRIDVDESGRLRQRPIAEVRALREDHQSVDSTTLSPGGDPLDVSGNALEIRMRAELVTADALEVTVLESPDGTERTPIRFDRESVVVDRTDSSLDADPASSPQRLPLDGSDAVDLHVFVDGSVIEVFVDEREVLTARVYPTRDDSTGLSVDAIGGDASIESLDVWTLGSCWTAPESE